MGPAFVGLLAGAAVSLAVNRLLASQLIGVKFYDPMTMAVAPAVVDASLGLGVLVALTPSGTTLCPPAKLRTPNSPGWPAGSRVEFFLHGVEVAEEFAPYGGWAKVSDGAVTADGSAVETDDAGGLPIISVVGVRLAR